MKPNYKKVKVLKAHCPECKVQLAGDNSIALPWTCECGKWEANKYPFTGEYKIITP